MSEYKKELRRKSKGADDNANPVEMAYGTAREKWGDGWEILSYELKEAAVAREALAIISAEVVNPDEQPAVFQLKRFAEAAFRIVHLMDGDGEGDEEDGT